MKSIKKNLVYNTLLNLLSVLSPLITAPYIARVLEPEGVGLLNFSSIYSGYFALVAALGIPTYGVREVAKLRDNKGKLSLLVSQLVSVSILTTIVVTIIYLTTLVVIDQLRINYIIFLISGFALYLSPIKVNWFFQGVEDFGYITLRSLIVNILVITSLFIFVHDKDDLIILIIIRITGGLLADFLNFIKMWKYGITIRFTLNGLQPHIKPLFILFASSIAISIYTVLDTLMLGFISNYEEVGYYNYAIRLSKMMLMIVTSLSIVAVPRISYYMEHKEYNRISDLMNKSFSFISFLAFPVAIGLMCIAPTLVPLFLGDKFVGTVVPLMILSLLIIVIGLSNLTGIQILIGMGYEKLYLYAVLTGTISNFILNCILIPASGAVGASVSSVLAELFVLLVTIYFVYKKTPIRIKSINDLSKSLIGALVFVPLVYLLRPVISGWFFVGCYTILCLILYMAFEFVASNSSVRILYHTIQSFVHKNSKEF